jgi:hypothetical protein
MTAPYDLLIQRLRLEVEGLRLLRCDSVLFSEHLWTFGRTVAPLSVVSSSPRSISPLTQYHIPADFNLQRLLISCRFEVVTTVTCNITVYRDVAPSSLVDQYQCFGANCWLHLQSSPYNFKKVATCFSELLYLYAKPHVHYVCHIVECHNPDS